MRDSILSSSSVLLAAGLLLATSSSHAADTAKPAAPAPAPAKPATTAAAGTTAPKAGTATPPTGTTAPKAGTATPPTGTTAPKAGTATPPAGTTAPKAGTATPPTGTTAPKTGTAAPKTGTPPAEPAAQTPKDKAEALVIAGRKLVDAHEADKAVELLEEAYGILQNPESGYELMRAYDEVGKLNEALTLGEKLNTPSAGPKETPNDATARKSIKESVTSLATRVSTIQLQIKRPSKDLVRVKVDDRTLLPEQLDKPVRVNPGKREILVTAPGYLPLTIPQVVEKGPAKQYPLTIDMTAVEGPKNEVVLPVQPEEPPSPTLKPLTKVGIIVSSALGAIAFGTGIGAAVSYTGFVDVYNRRGCTTNCDAEVEKRGGTLQALTLTSTITGVAAIAAGTLTFLSARADKKSQTGMNLTIAPTAGGFVVHGRW